MSSSTSMPSRVVEFHFYVVAIEMLLYGAYSVLFGIYVFILRQSGTLAKTRVLNLAIMALFLFGTAHLAILLASNAIYNRLSTSDDVSQVQTWVNLDTAANMIYVTSNVVADGIFIFRCYAIWGFQRKIIVLPVLCTLYTAGAGYAQNLHVYEYSPELLQDYRQTSLFFSIATSLGTTVVLMCLSAGRIWWLARKADIIIGPQTKNRHFAVVAMILESGAVYGVGGLVILILCAMGVNTQHPTSGAILAQLVGIAPTIIAVRVGLGKSVESVDSFIDMDPRPPRPTPDPEDQCQIEPPGERSIQQPVFHLSFERHVDVEKSGSV